MYTSVYFLNICTEYIFKFKNYFVVMEISYSDHAKKRMRIRGIEGWEVEHILKFPSYIKKSFEGRKESVGLIRDRIIKIVYIKEENYIKIITVI